MAVGRGIFQTTITRPVSITVSGVTVNALEALSGIEISVFQAGTWNAGTQTGTPVAIYQSDDITNNAQGPVPGAGASGGPNPFTTGLSGSVEFWVPAGRYDIRIRDTQAQPRLAERVLTRFPIVSAVGLPTSVLDTDGGVALGHVGADILRQSVPIGGVIDWWRPSSAVAIPNGFAVCDGHAEAVHDFGIAGAVNLPDLRNKMILGANADNADAAGAGTDELAASAPGIRGSGGSHFINLRHSHTVNNHDHDIGGHAHTVSAHGHWFGAEAPGLGTYGGGCDVGGGHTHPGPGTRQTGATGGTVRDADYANGHQHNIWGQNGGVNNHGHGFQSESPGTGGSNWSRSGGSTPDTNQNLSTAQDNRAAWVGLLKIMKVRRS